ncbi:hypothetical protein C8F01DRAFT_1183945 [Mycena amicta]|nr:hypothetical protein C8F01DRAFT_1183945 [Mycena amicta]
MSNDSEPPPGLSSARDDPESESNLTHLLTSNDPPPETEITLVQEIIRGAEAAEPASESLLRVESYRAILSPVRQLPLELLIAIFCFVHWPCHYAPWSLGLVCRRWRVAALACPSLWSLIRVPNLRSGDFRHSSMNEQLSRTGNSPLRLWWRDGFSDKISAKILKSLLPTSHRWVTITLKDFREEQSHEWIVNFKGHIPALQRLEIFSANSITMGDVFFRAPNLTHVLLSEPEHHARSPSWTNMTLPSAQITHYRAAYTGVFGVLTHNMSHLVYCVLAYEGNNWGWRQGRVSDVDITFPHLERLHIVDLRMLQQFTAPALNVLCVFSPSGGAGVEDAAAFAFILPFLERSGRTSALSQLNVFDAPDQILPVLCVLSGLRSLLVEARWHDAVDILDALVWRMDRTNILPNLQRLVWGYCEPVARPSPPPEVFAVVESRSQRLSLFRIYDTRTDLDSKPVSESVSAVVQQLQKSGVDAGVIDRFHPLLEVERWGGF